MSIQIRLLRREDYPFDCALPRQVHGLPVQFTPAPGYPAHIFPSRHLRSQMFTDINLAHSIRSGCKPAIAAIFLLSAWVKCGKLTEPGGKLTPPGILLPFWIDRSSHVLGY